MASNIKAGSLIFRDAGTKNDSGYFLVRKVEEVTKKKYQYNVTTQWSSGGNYVDYQVNIIFANKVAHLDGKECNGKTIREFNADDTRIMLVDQSFIDKAYDEELQAVQEKRETLTALLEEFSAADV